MSEIESDALASDADEEGDGKSDEEGDGEKDEGGLFGRNYESSHSGDEEAPYLDEGDGEEGRGAGSGASSFGEDPQVPNERDGEEGRGEQTGPPLLTICRP